MTIYFQSHQITVYRQRRNSGTDRFSLSATYTGYTADIQPASGSVRQSMPEQRYGTLWTAYVDSSVQIKEGDVVVSGGKQYGVQGIVEWRGAGLLDHKELTLISKDGV